MYLSFEKGPIYNVFKGPVLEGPDYSLSRWEQRLPNEHEVVATTQDGCKGTTLTITAKEVFQTYRYGGSGDNPHCVGGAARIVKLIDASKFSEDYYAQSKGPRELLPQGIPRISRSHTPDN